MGNTKRENEMKKALGRNAVHILTHFYSATLSIVCDCALIVCALKAWMFGFDTFLADIFWSNAL